MARIGLATSPSARVGMSRSSGLPPPVTFSTRKRRSRCCSRRNQPFFLLLIPLLPLVRLYFFSRQPNKDAAPTAAATTDQPINKPANNVSLRHALSSGVIGGLRSHCGYFKGLGMWNGFPHIATLLQRAGYEHWQPGSESSWVGAATLVVPNYWRPGAEDWRKWRLLPYQRINRLWGMISISRKETLVKTLDAHYGRAGCPFTPPTYSYEELRKASSRTEWKERIEAHPHWLLKTSAHRGQGLRVVSSRLCIGDVHRPSSCVHTRGGLCAVCIAPVQCDEFRWQ